MKYKVIYCDCNGDQITTVVEASDEEDACQYVLENGVVDTAYGDPEAECLEKKPKSKKQLRSESMEALVEAAQAALAAGYNPKTIVNKVKKVVATVTVTDVHEA